MSRPMILYFHPSDAGGYIVCDARNRHHAAANEKELWQLLDRLSKDKTLPAAKIAESNDFIGIAAGLARRALPKHVDLVDAAEPAAHSLSALGPVLGPMIDRLRGDR